jgi:ADP-ribose pyrophosphatase
MRPRKGVIVRIERRQHSLRGLRLDTPYVAVGNVSAVAGIDQAGRVAMVEQYRPAVDAVTWELPAGRCDLGEDPEAAARREFEEETGMRAETLRLLLRFWPAPGMSDEVMHLYLGSDLSTGQQQPDADEEILRVLWLTANQRQKALRSGQIADAKTVLGLIALDGNIMAHAPLGEHPRRMLQGQAADR